MNFHDNCNCRLELSKESIATIRYSIISGSEHVGSVRFCSILGEWIVTLCPNVGVTCEYMSKIWASLLYELAMRIE